MNREDEKCPSCKIMLSRHNNQQISNCIKKQLEKNKKPLANYSGKCLTKEASFGGAVIV